MLLLPFCYILQVFFPAAILPGSFGFVFFSVVVIGEGGSSSIFSILKVFIKVLKVLKKVLIKVLTQGIKLEKNYLFYFYIKWQALKIK